MVLAIFSSSPGRIPCARELAGYRRCSHGAGKRCLTTTSTRKSKISSITKNHPSMPPSNHTIVCTALTHTKSYSWSRQIGQIGTPIQRTVLRMKQNQHRDLSNFTATVSVRFCRLRDTRLPHMQIRKWFARQDSNLRPPA